MFSLSWNTHKSHLIGFNISSPFIFIYHLFPCFQLLTVQWGAVIKQSIVTPYCIQSVNYAAASIGMIPVLYWLDMIGLLDHRNLNIVKSWEPNMNPCFHGHRDLDIEAETKWRMTHRWLFIKKNIFVLIQISLKFVPRDPIYNKLSLVQIMDWHRTGDMLLYEPVILTHVS